LLALSDPFERHDAVDKGEQRVISAQPDVVAGPKPGAALSHQNTASRYTLAPKLFHAKPLGLTVTAVAGTSTTFFMCHILFSGMQETEF